MSKYIVIQNKTKNNFVNNYLEIFINELNEFIEIFSGTNSKYAESVFGTGLDRVVNNSFMMLNNNNTNDLEKYININNSESETKKQAKFNLIELDELNEADKNKNKKINLKLISEDEIKTFYKENNMDLPDINLNSLSTILNNLLELPEWNKANIDMIEGLSEICQPLLEYVFLILNLHKVYYNHVYLNQTNDNLDQTDKFVKHIDEFQTQVNKLNEDTIDMLSKYYVSDTNNDNNNKNISYFEDFNKKLHDNSDKITIETINEYEAKTNKLLSMKPNLVISQVNYLLLTKIWDSYELKIVRFLIKNELKEFLDFVFKNTKHFIQYSKFINEFYDKNKLEIKNEKSDQDIDEWIGIIPDS